MELPEAFRRHAAGEIEIVPLLLYKVDWDNDCPELKRFNPLPVFGRSWWEYHEGGGDYKSAMHLIGSGLKGAIEKARARKLMAKRL